MGRGISSLNTKKVAYCVRLKEHREEESINASSFKFDGLSGHQNKSSHLFFHLCGRRIHILLAKIIAQEPPFFLLRESLPVMEMRRWNNLMNVKDGITSGNEAICLHKKVPKHTQNKEFPGVLRCFAFPNHFTMRHHRIPKSPIGFPDHRACLGSRLTVNGVGDSLIQLVIEGALGSLVSHWGQRRTL